MYLILLVIYRSVFFFYCFLLFFFFFFFFQAEDGIRDDLVTGVQTCALPISLRPDRKLFLILDQTAIRFSDRRSPRIPTRSEERRVGKECRSRGSPYH